MPDSRKMYTDERLIAGIQAGGTERDQCIQHIFDQYAGFIVKLKQEKRLTIEEAKDVYVDSVVALADKVGAGKFKGQSKLSTYLYRIFSNKCIDLIRKKASRQAEMTYEYPEMKDGEQNALELLAVGDQVLQLKDALNKLGDRCQQILMDWAYYGYNMSEIADRAGLKDSHSAYSQKYKCLKKLREQIKTTYPYLFDAG